jgi:ubiquinone/menaquinone biosynthesis C-methylase UbiE
MSDSAIPPEATNQPASTGTTSSSSSGNTYLYDPEDPVELARLINVDRLVTRIMGGPLSGLTEEEIASLHNVIDLGCGPGGWVLDVAFEHPDVEVAGVDISRAMIDYANARARSQELTNASFGIMDINKPLEFADGSFDLVNSRFLTAVLVRKAWEPFIAEASRLVRPGGILRLTEMVDVTISTSAALMELNQVGYRNMWKMGYGFSPNGGPPAVSVVLPHLLRRAGYQRVQHRAHILEFSADTENWADFYHNLEIFWLLGKPLQVQSGAISEEDFDRLYQQALTDMQQPDFCGMWHLVTAWGTKP